ncbi:MAG: MBL fold metallo-hydrolase RNA specificity domain-containing protein [Acidobacteriota bacterium]
MTLQFWGATRTVTGSKYLLELATTRWLVDCGLFQGLKELRQRNWDPLFAALRPIDGILLTHAHLDHSGMLPRLVREGYDGPIYCTRRTHELCKLLLPDSGRLQEEDTEIAIRRGVSRHEQPLPLYTEADALRALQLFRPLPFHQLQQLPDQAAFQFIPAGHIIGSAYVDVRLQHKRSGEIKILFGGDLGGYDVPILNDPEAISETDYLLVESTYGNRLHDRGASTETLKKVIIETEQKKGRLFLPSFAVGRAQHLLYVLRELELKKEIPVLPVYLDSPMAAGATASLLSGRDEHDIEMRALSIKGNPLITQKFHRVTSHRESLQIAAARNPAIIIAGSGMATGGRILNYFEQGIENPDNTVAFAGFQAEGTRGRAMIDGAPAIKLRGSVLQVRCRVVSIDGFSAHADYREILRWLKNFKRPPRATFLVHGEMGAMQALKTRIETELGWPSVTMPEFKQSVPIQ